MVAFAEATDLERRWRSLSTAEKASATVLLEDASVAIRAECLDAGIDADDLPADLTRMVACAIVKRSMQAATSEVGDGVTAYSTGTGPFTESLTFANPTGELYLTKAEKKRLGILRAKGRAFTVDTSRRST
ncbi:Gp19/Gp15/Gp42 family protein [Rhodococcus sp. PD04]|uniref:Gp19/Gp15/Gp42 family protein n=1 Tax=Rhodococcus sp. PD04 TaxID=3109594 RepID=UPI002DDBDCA0|nr:Gp19/Gp15/Gp42 family protein [Rhodococcus sp. PD04]WSE22330.1 Gp19/Gp15/Gp42 family protein [Rhodococcus sp. PD04]